MNKSIGNMSENTDANVDNEEKTTALPAEASKETKDEYENAIDMYIYTSLIDIFNQTFSTCYIVDHDVNSYILSLHNTYKLNYWFQFLDAYNYNNNNDNNNDNYIINSTITNNRYVCM